MEIDVELLKQESVENPLYYIQGVHSGIESTLDRARNLNIDWSRGDVALLKDETELGLIRAMIRLPELVLLRRGAKDVGAFQDSLASLMYELLNCVLAGAAVHLRKHGQSLVANLVILDVRVKAVRSQVSHGGDGHTPGGEGSGQAAAKVYRR